MNRSPRYWGTGLEKLEVRQMLAASVRSIDGTGNNLANPDWGSVGDDLLRKAAAAYANGLSAPAGTTTRPSARDISNSVAVASADEDADVNNRNMSPFVYAWGQFLDHDL